MSPVDHPAARLDDVDPQARYAWSDEDEAWRRKAHEFAARHVAPQARQADRDGRFAADLVPALGQAGLLGPALPPAVGGGGATWMADCLVAEAIGAVDGSVRGFLAVQGGLVCAALAAFATEAQREAWLPGLLAGERIGCYALTEEGAGSDVGAIATRIREDGDDVVIDGEKVWITNGGVADVMLVFGTMDAALGTKGLACAIVPAGTEGVTREAMPGRELGHRASNHAHLTFRGVRVPRTSRLGSERGGFQVAMHGLEAGRLNVAAGAVGIQQACLDARVAFARSPAAVRAADRRLPAGRSHARGDGGRSGVFAPADLPRGPAARRGPRGGRGRERRQAPRDRGRGAHGDEGPPAPRLARLHGRACPSNATTATPSRSRSTRARATSSA